MSSSLRNVALAWNLGFRFFLDPSTSPRFLLDWDHHNADGTCLVLGYGVESFHAASLETYSGPASGSRGAVGPEPVCRADLLLHCWLVTSRSAPAGVLHFSFFQFLNRALAPPLRPLPTLPVFEFRATIEEYPQEWSLDAIAHQHFLACAWLGFWCIEERGPARWPIRICWLRRPTATAPPAMFDELLDRMVLTFENLMTEYRRAREDHIEEADLCKQLFELVLNIEHTLFWMSCLGFWVAWSVHYNQLLEQLFPEVLSEFPPAQRQAEFTRLRAHLFFSRNPSSTLPEDTQSGINPLDAPTSIARLRLIPWDGSSSDMRSGFQPDPSSNVASARGATVRFSFSGVLEYLDELASSDGRRVPTEEMASPGGFFVGEALDREIALAGLSPDDFLGATLPPLTSVGEGTAQSSDAPPRTQKRPRRRTPTEPRADRETPRSPFALSRWRGSVCREPLCALCFLLVDIVTTLAVCACWRSREGYPGRPRGVALLFLDEVLQHLRGGERHGVAGFPGGLLGAPRVGFFSAVASRPSRIPQRTAPGPAYDTCRGASSEDDALPPKRHKTSPPHEAPSPEVIVVTDEDGDLRYPEDADGDVSMHSPDPPIRADPRNYDPTLEPAPAAVPPEQHASSSRSTLDDPPSNTPDLHFLRFRLRPMEALSPSSRTAFVNEIVNWADQSGAGEERIESALLFMSAIFGQAGNMLGRRRRDRKGKGRAAS
ncbi:hypothetical protein DFH08DRAFT_804837 [Mycena albidolilacea]|uniref:Uncharacterized protein n=1 Tax=Mycena albidolilacea TaxID=1033008 RepID=A0AAD7AA47_9AGAR|nr:hypothetical protein DFH08DRAFT_804837 [Mycena albidolilacea]